MDSLDRSILDRLQSGFPLVSRPFAALGAELGIGEAELLGRVRALCRAGLIRRIGPVVDPAKAGRAGTLAAASVPPERLETVAGIVSASQAVTHNYLRVPTHGACPYNLWFTLTAESPAALREAVATLARATGLAIATFPSVRKFKIGVRFSLADDAARG